MSFTPFVNRSSTRTTRLWGEFSTIVDLNSIGVTASTTASFIQPSVGGNVTVTGSFSAFSNGMTVAVSGPNANNRGGTYYALSATSTSMQLKLISAGATPGSTIASGSSVTSVAPVFTLPIGKGPFYVTDMWVDSFICPGFGDTTRPTISIGWNKGGIPYSEYYAAQQLTFASTLSSGTSCSSTIDSFLQPAIDSERIIRLNAPAVYQAGTWNYIIGQQLRILRSGLYSVSSFITTNTTNNYTQPALNGSVTISVGSTTDFSVGEFIWTRTTSLTTPGVYEITAKTATSLTCTLRNAGSSFMQTASGIVYSPGTTVIHAQKLGVTLVDDSQVATAGTVPAGVPVIPYSDSEETTTASFVQPLAGGATVDIQVTDNRQFVVGTNVWLTPNTASNQAGFYSVIRKTNVNNIGLQLVTAGDYASGSTVPSGMRIAVRRQSTAPLALRSYGTSRIAVEEGATLGVYVSVAGNATTANLAEVFVRGYFVV